MADVELDRGLVLGMDEAIGGRAARKGKHGQTLCRCTRSLSLEQQQRAGINPPLARDVKIDVDARIVVHTGRRHGY